MRISKCLSFISSAGFISLASGCDGSSSNNANEELPGGPVKCHFDASAPGGSTVTWTVEPAGNHAAAHIEAAPYCSAGFSCNLGKDAQMHDVSAFDTLELDAVVAEGTAFDVSIGRMHGSTWHGCYWNLTGIGDTTYSIDLRAPSGCGPTMCQFDLQIQNVFIGAAYGGEGGTDATIEVRRVEFKTKISAAGTTKLGASGIGPDGACWFIAPWGASTGRWATPLTTSSARVTGGAALTRELGGVDVSQGQRIEFDATIDSQVSVSLSDMSADPGNNTCWWNIAGRGKDTYTIEELNSPTRCWGPGALDLKRIGRIAFTGETNSVVEINTVRVKP